MLGYGLKLPDAFDPTHLGGIGRRTLSSSTARCRADAFFNPLMGSLREWRADRCRHLW